MIRAVLFLAAFVALAGCASTGTSVPRSSGDVPETISTTDDNAAPAAVV
ncbi:hypothetical protein [Devosia epidermidihirudinis]|nr:hypothetical protein [Devosia epidermidihirudinis]